MHISFSITFAFLVGCLTITPLLVETREENQELKIILDERNQEIDRLKSEIKGMLNNAR